MPRSQRGEEVGLGQRGERRGLLRTHRPDERVAAVEGQQRQRTLGGKALVGGVAGSRRDFDDADHRVLRVALLFRFRRRSFGVYHAAGRCFVGRNEIRNTLAQRASHACVIGDIAERGDAAVAGVEPRLAERATLGDVDGLDRRRGDSLPGADSFENQAACVGERDRAERGRCAAALDDFYAQP